MSKGIPQLTGIRGFAALWVALFHFSNFFPLAASAVTLIQPFSGHGYLAVDLFFILSGFILSYAHRADFTHCGPGRFVQNTARFLYLRVARIYPVHLTFLIINVTFFCKGRPGDVFVVPWLWNNILNIEGLVNVTHPLFINYFGWSVGAEWVLYWLFPVLIFALSKGYNRLGGIIISIASLGLLWLYFQHHPGGQAGMLDLIAGWGCYVRLMTAFCFGLGLHMIYHDNPKLAKVFDALSALILAAIPVCLWQSVNDVFIVAMLGGLIYCLARSRAWMAKSFSHRSVFYAGQVSFSFYMVHPTLEKIFIEWFKIPFAQNMSPFEALRVLVLFFGFAALGAVIVYEAVERPARDYLRWLLPKRPKTSDSGFIVLSLTPAALASEAMSNEAG